MLFIDRHFTRVQDEYLDPARYPYREFPLLSGARYGDRRVAWWPYIFVDNDAALARGWIQGFPKRLASVFMMKAVMDGCGSELIDLAKVNLTC